MRARIALLVVALSAAYAGCAAKNTPIELYTTPPELVRERAIIGPTEVRIGRFGIACRTGGRYIAGVPHSGPIEYPSYSPADAGKPGVPALTKLQSELLARIRHYVHDSSVRFVFLPPGWYSRTGLIVFDPKSDGPCSYNGFPVLNQRSPGNIYYSPGSENYIYAMMWGPTTGPWMR